ncbi:sigma-54 interaction domain-containing protein [Gynuella sunshinyii]|nr:sigma-54 dependent transcriptional regulator [Gynuella sunshinyii]
MHTNPGYQPHSYQGLLTVSKRMQQFMAKVEKVARTNASVLLRGETGTGKEMVARYIHRCSPRGVGAFSAVNCAALSGELMASELFGHKKGAFTGATHDRRGLLELTNGGSLFLDEIAEMPLDIQARLLRVLQDRCFTPLGSSQLMTTDIRLISATHQSLRKRVAEGAFREDLMYRVRVIPMFLPKLVERGEDLSMLIWHFIDRFNAISERRIESIDSKAWNALMSYEWPGNVRELSNVIEYCHAIGDGSVLLFDDLNPDLKGEGPADEQLYFDDENERDQILELLRRYRGRKLEVAQKLGISRATLWRKLKLYGID